MAKIDVPHFLLPAGGALTTTEYFLIDVFRPGLSNVTYASYFMALIAYFST